jgi:hypothetical protein
MPGPAPVLRQYLSALLHDDNEEPGSRCLAPLVSVVDSANARESDDVRRGGGPMRDAPRLRCVLGQAEMAAVVMVIRQVRTNQLPEVSVAQDDNVLEQLSPTVPDPALCHRILPRTAVRRSGGLGAHGPHEAHHRGCGSRKRTHGVTESNRPGERRVHEEVERSRDHGAVRRRRRLCPDVMIAG